MHIIRVMDIKGICVGTGISRCRAELLFSFSIFIFLALIANFSFNETLFCAVPESDVFEASSVCVEINGVLNGSSGTALGKRKNVRSPLYGRRHVCFFNFSPFFFAGCFLLSHIINGKAVRRVPVNDFSKGFHILLTRIRPLRAGPYSF